MKRRGGQRDRKGRESRRGAERGRTPERAALGKGEGPPEVAKEGEGVPKSEPRSSEPPSTAKEQATGSAGQTSSAASTSRWSRLLTLLGLVACIGFVGWTVSQPLQLRGVPPLAEQELRRALAEELRVEAAPGSRPGSNPRVDAWIGEHPQEYAARLAEFEERILDANSFVHRGERFPYVGGYDGYLWLRQARNLLDTGTVCDEVVDGRCWDSLALAPGGTEMTYRRSVHLLAIAGVQAVLGPLLDFPLEGSALLLSALVAALAVIPGFAIGRRLAGLAGGLAGAVFAVVNAPFISRITAADNDVWNVALPLWTAWALLAALDEVKPIRRGGFLAVAIAVQCVHLVSWSGALFSYLVVLASAGVVLAVGALESVRSGHRWWFRERSVWEPAAGVAGFVAVTALVAAWFGSGDVFSQIAGRVGAMFGSRARSSEGPGFVTALDSVNELAAFGWQTIVERFGFKPFAFAAGLGLTLMFLPRGRWRGQDLVPVALAVVASGVAIGLDDASAFLVSALLAAPALVALGLRVRRDRPGPPSLAAPVLVLVWALFGLQLVFRANRFELLATPALGFAAIVVVDRVAGWLGAWAAERAPSRVALGVFAVVFALGLVAIRRPVIQGHQFAGEQLPRLTRAWHDALVGLRERSQQGAIVNLWWDQGHWAKYYAERGVSGDGSTLRAQSHHWFSRALLAPTVSESLGLLRLIDCGSGAAPMPERTPGAYTRLQSAGRALDATYSLLDQLARSTRSEAGEALAQAGLAAEAEAILERTHCAAPEAYLVLDMATALMPKPWTRLAAWRPGHPSPEGVAYAYPGWLPCGERSGVFRCKIARRHGAGELVGFTFNPQEPSQSVVHRSSGGTPFPERPEALLLASQGRLTEVTPAGPANGIGILVDPELRGIMVGDPALLRSTFTRLMFLGPEYAPGFERIDEHVDAQRNRVRVWRIDWPE